MTAFSQSALGMLKCAESALAGESTLRYKGRFADGGEVPISQAYPTYGDVASAAVPSADRATVLLLSQQLQEVMKEMTALKSELAAERDGRSDTLTALGKRWRESILVEVRSGDHHIARDVAAVEERVAVQLKTDAAANAAVRRQVEDLARRLSARDASQFEAQESLHDEFESLRRQLAEVSTLCTTVRVETARQVEREREALSHRLDVELLRYVDMRQEDQRELQKVKALVKDELLRVGAHVREMVNESWQTCATALETSLRDSLAQLERDGKQNKQAVQDMHELVSNSVRTIQAECRVQTAAFKERLAALESNEAVMVSRVDRAEKKSDAAHDTVSRLSAEVQSQRESLDRNGVAAQRATDLAVRVEATQLDRDTRLTKVEQHLQATTTAEMLRAEVEGCKRAVGRAESRVDALSAVCSRAEEAAERSARGVESAVDRAMQSDKSAAKATLLVQEIAGRVGQCEQRVAAVENVKDEVTAAVERQDLFAVRLEQRVTTTESRLRVMNERHEQVTQDLTRTQEAHGARIEAAHEVATRSDAASAIAKAEVNRLEKRLVKIETAATTFAAECASIHAEVQDGAKGIDDALAQHRQMRERLEASEARFAERSGDLDSLQASVSETMTKVTSRVEKQLTSFADHTQERLGQLEGQLRELSGKGDVERRITHRVNEWQTKVKDFVTEQYRHLKHRCEGIEHTVQDQQTKLTQLEEDIAAEQNLSKEWQSLRNMVASLEATTQQRTAQCTQSIASTRDSLRALQDELVTAQEDLGHTRQQLQKAQRELEANKESIGALQRRLDAALIEQQAATKRALSAAESVAQRLALSLDKPLSPQSTSTTIMAGSNSADVSSPSAHVPSLQRAATQQTSQAPSQREVGNKAAAGSRAESAAAPTGDAPPPGIPPLSARASVGSHTSSLTRDATLSSDQQASPSAPPAQAEALPLRSQPRQQAAPHSHSQLSSISSVHAPSDPHALPSGSSSLARASSSAEAAAAAAPAAPAPLAVCNTSVFNTSGQRTVIQRFNALDDSTTDELDSVVSNQHARRPRGEDATEDATTTTTTTTTPSRPAPRAAAPLEPPANRSDDEEGEYEEEESSAETGALHTSSQPVDDRRAPVDWDDDEEEEGSPLPDTAAVSGAMNAGEEEDSDSSDLVLPMQGTTTEQARGGPGAGAASSPSPARPVLGTATGGLQATPRKAFVHSSDDEDDPLRHEEVPMHGKSTTTSSSSGERRSASGGDARGTDVGAAREAAANSRPSGTQAIARPTNTRYTAFDDSDDDDAEEF